jgi:beta-lactamase class A
MKPHLAILAIPRRLQRMLSNLRTLVTGKLLSTASKEHLVGWLIGNKTGDARLRAGLPGRWRVGDKTGSGEKGTTNDIAVIWPSSDREPIFVTAYLTGSSPEMEHRNATLAAVGLAVANSLGYWRPAFLVSRRAPRCHPPA